jgi:hypothetical protein
VVPARAITDQFSFWEHELLKDPEGHAVIHDKIVVIDPFSPACVVVTGSHNLGYRASYNNDENMLIIRGKRKLAEAYAAHVLDVYDHYRFRFQVQQHGDQAWSGLDGTDGWQDKYYAPGSPSLEEAGFWQAGLTPGVPTLLPSVPPQGRDGQAGGPGTDEPVTPPSAPEPDKHAPKPKQAHRRKRSVK